MPGRAAWYTPSKILFPLVLAASARPVDQFSFKRSFIGLPHGYNTYADVRNMYM